MRYAAGTPTALPLRVLIHLVAIRYGQSPAAVRSWAADDFLAAVRYLELIPGGSDGGS